ncbi:MAG: hypothetical protein M3680_36645 [Myxococcota bacterium]|nr:hypothetical protein [Myxococcota bacterium]
MTSTTLVIIMLGALSSAAIASAKRRNVGGWLLCGALFPIISVIVLACLRPLVPAPDLEVID